MQIADGELGSLDMHGKVHFTSPREILNVTVSTVFGSAGHGTCALLADFLFDVR
jgi:hypothetical protein